MGLTVYKGRVISLEIPKSLRLKKSLSDLLGRDVQPLQIRAELTHFRDLETPDRTFECFEKDINHTGNEVVYNNLIGEYICGIVGVGKPPLAESLSEYQLVTPQGELLLRGNVPCEMSWLCRDVELEAKYRRKDGKHMRTAPPEWEGSRRVWRLSNAVLIGVEYLSIAQGASTEAQILKKEVSV